MSKYLPYMKGRTNPELKGGKISALFFLRRSGKIIYIGFSANLAHKISQHKKFNFDDFRFILCDWQRASIYSRRLMRIFKPEMNHEKLISDKQRLPNGPILKERFATESGFLVESDGRLTFKGQHRSKVYLNMDGYYRISMKLFGRSFNVLVHRIQAYQKFGNSIYKKGIVVRHLNGVKTDNSYNNIAIGTCLDNARDVPIEVRKKAAIKAQDTRRMARRMLA